MRSQDDHPFVNVGEEIVVRTPECTCEQNVGDLFEVTIVRLYRAAIEVDPSPRSQIAYGCYLAEHGQCLESIREFDNILNIPGVAHDSALLAEIVHHLARIQNRLTDDDMVGSSAWSLPNWWEDAGKDEPLDPEDGYGEGVWSYFEIASEFADVIRELMGGCGGSPDRDLSAVLAGLDHRLMEEVGELLQSLRRHRTACQQRRTGLSLLKLALSCGKQNWCRIEVECIRKAVRCFEQAAADVHQSRRHSLGGRATLATGHS